MRKIFTISISVLLFSCMSESSVSPGSSSTFIRYYNGGNNDEAKALLRTPDGGFLILANTKIQKAEADIPQFKIKLIKTDKSGNPLWTRFYPEFDDKTKNYQASSMQILYQDPIAKTTPTGYVIIGDDIQTTGIALQNPVSSFSTKVLLVHTESEKGDTIRTGSYDYGKGKAIDITKANGNYLCLTISSQDNNMYLLEIDKTTHLPVSGHAPSPYPFAGETTLANKLLIDETDKAVWSGTVTKSGLTGIRAIKTVPTNINTEFDLLISRPPYNLTGSDICRYGNIYAVTGSTNRKPTAYNPPTTDTDIFFARISSAGDTLSTMSFPLDDPKTPQNEDNQNDVGNSISTTIDGGLVILSSVSSVAIGGRGDTDFYLIKIDAFGNQNWTSSFGSRFKDEGVSVLQSEDGGFIVLGTTTQGGLKMVALVKTDKNGKID
jgi:hypothetical protein